MKRMLLALPLFMLTLSAMAKNNPDKLPASITNAVTDKFAPIVCHQGLNAAIKAVQKCYQDTPTKYQHIEQCMIMDIAVIALTNIDNETRKKYQLPIKYTTSYININQYDERINKYRKTIPEYMNYDQQDFLKYIGNGANSLIIKIFLLKQDKTAHCVE